MRDNLARLQIEGEWSTHPGHASLESPCWCDERFAFAALGGSALELENSCYSRVMPFLPVDCLALN